MPDNNVKDLIEELDDSFNMDIKLVEEFEMKILIMR